MGVRSGAVAMGESMMLCAGVSVRGFELTAGGGLADPEGDFVEAIGRQHSAEQAARIVREHMGDWKDGVKKG